MKKFGLKSIVCKILILILCLFSFGASVVNPVEISNTPTKMCSAQANTNFPKLKEIIKTLFKKNKKQNSSNAEKTYVYLGGYPLGFAISCDGVIVVANSNESASDIEEGDVIIKIQNESVNSADDILKVINKIENVGRDLSVTYLEKGVEKTTTVKPIFDREKNLYKLGVWVRDNAAGVGTITYIRKDNLRFGALGHPVCDIDTGTLLPVNEGNIYRCSIMGYKKGKKGNPGELKGLFLRSGRILGTLDENNKFGVYGKFSDKFLEDYQTNLVEVASHNEIKNGKATIRCTIEGTVPKDYDIEIVKTYFNNEKDNKSMFIRVTDKELIEKTGGIIQGMSGSPVIQNGKLVGAITHVFVNDPTKGYAVFADYMIEN
ncbi:MAG: SpoIVB peptidase [Clostridia bacterium]|nr:SpoIVB peptidase [Clostridia bacterium]